VTASRIVTAPGVHPVFQVAAGDVDVTTGQAQYDVARYDTAPGATYSGPDAQWTDDTCDAIDATTFYGRQRSIDAFDVGTATFRVANPTGLWDYPPADLQTPLTVRPGRMVRVGVQLGTAPPAWLWTGWIDGTEPGYDPAIGDVVTVTCVCAKGEAGRVDAGRVTTQVGDGDTADARMVRLADIAAFAPHRRLFDASGVTLVGTGYGARVGALMDDVGKSSGGDVYGDENGYLTYRGKDWQTRTPGTPPDGHIGNRGVAGEVCPNRWEVSFLRADYSSRVVYARSGEDTRQLDDLVNQGRFGVETFSMTSMATKLDADLNLLAARALRVRNFNLAPRVAAVSVDAARPGVADLLVAASPFTPSVYSCGHVTDDGRVAFERTLYLTGVEHTITAAAWTARLALDDASPWLTNALSRYDAARYDVDVYAKAV
jgi:hypothetical protein